MSTDTKYKLKEIMNCTDLNSLSAIMPHLSDTGITELAQLLEQRRTLDSEIKQKRDDTRSLSRQIGEAKKQGNNTDTLLADMRAISSDIKKLDENRRELEDEVLSYIPEDDTAKSSPSTAESVHVRQYRVVPDDEKIHISELQADSSKWNHYVEQQPAATIYHRAEWRDVIRETFGHESYYYYAHDGAGNFIGVLPLIRLKSRLFGDFMVSMPYFNYGGAVGDSPAIENALIQHANRESNVLGLQHIEYRDDITRTGMPVRKDKVNMILQLPSDENTLWQSFSPKLRSQIRRPQREDTRVESGGLELLDDFYKVFARNMRDLGTPVYDKVFFATILRSFPYHSHILTVYLAGNPVASAFLIGCKERLEIPWASTIRSANHLSVNMLMYWKVLCFAIQKEYQSFDFGRSSVDSGTYNFKKQ